jgi:Tfp pilus assembly protein PilF
MITSGFSRREVGAMRALVTVVGLVVALIAAIGVAGRATESAPVAPPTRAGLATAAPVAPSAATRSAPGEPAPDEPAVASPGSRLEARRLLAARDFATLTQRFVATRALAAADVRREGELERLVLAFNVDDPAMTALLDTWLKAEPETWPVHVARAEHFIARGFAARGTKTRDKTAKDQFVGLDEWLKRAGLEATAALRLDPALIEAYRALIAIAQAKGDQDACLRFGERALDFAPGSARVRFAVAYCLLPRWGGSYDALEALAEDSRPYVKTNPALAALGGVVAWDRGRVAAGDGEGDDAYALFNRALEAGEAWDFYLGRARVHEKRKHYSDALADLAQALALRPEEPDLLAIRARVSIALGRNRDAAADVRLVAELDPNNQDLAWLRRHEAEAAVSRGRYLLESVKDADGAVARLTDGIAIAGADPPLLFWRARAYIEQRKLDLARTDLEDAIRADPRAIESYRTLDWLLARQQRWDEIIAHWDAYIALEPLSGDAYLERAETHYHNGNRPAALADAKRACELGVEKGCQLSRRGLP